ncbi:MAG: 30S ribosomal protein S6--L-glutamate ligase, partial [Gemmatimonadetes bacterium]|nr:30S ribosomal protein S6--L-glutamate ligase [Gemmatimonadota bacterium]
RVVGAMRRVAKSGEFRSNVHRGGSAEAVDLDDEQRRTAVSAAQILGLRVAGVDMLEGKDGPQVMEVNSSPGLEGIEGATQLDIAGEIVDYMAGQVDFPEIDIRQRMTESAGYGVVEVGILEESDLVGRTIEASGLRDRDIVVITLTRGTTVISNPKGTRTLEPLDRLLCYGKLDQMRSLVSNRRGRRQPSLQPLITDVPSQAIDGNQKEA